MLVLETCVFLLFVGACCLWSLLRDNARQRRDRKQARKITAVVSSLVGSDVAQAEKQFGPPYEVFHGHFGRDLYVWKAPPSQNLPAFRGTVVVTVTASSEGQITETAWKRQ